MSFLLLLVAVEEEIVTAVREAVALGDPVMRVDQELRDKVIMVAHLPLVLMVLEVGAAVHLELAAVRTSGQRDRNLARGHHHHAA